MEEDVFGSWVWEGDKEEQEREKNKHLSTGSLGNLKGASRGEQPFSALLREEGISVLSSLPTD